MKKILFSALMMAAAFSAGAQTMYDAITFSTNNYYGTARTIGMGNAVTAVGGDLGSFGINPAAGSVASYSQVTASFGFTTASSNARFAPSYNFSTESQNFDSPGFSNSKTRMTVPNIGLNLVFAENGAGAVKAWNIGFVLNRTQTFANVMSASGLEGRTSITGAFATAADGMPGNILGSGDIYDKGYGWNQVAAYDGGLINYNYDAGTYYGSAEQKRLDAVEGKYHYEVLGDLIQKVGTTTTGSKNDLTVNYGVNINDRLFLGANLTIPIINYKYNEFFDETAEDSDYFPVTPEFWSNRSGSYVTGDPTHYLGSTYKYSYVADVTGANLKIGAIWLPTDGLRLGAAIQTPTAYTVHEKWFVDVNADFENSEYNASASSPTAESTYDFLSAWSWNAGVAYTFGKFGMVSADYEMTSYKSMSFSTTSEDGFSRYEDPFYQVNRLNELFCGVSHSVRLGVEVRPVPHFSFRGGFNLTTSPEKFYKDTDGYKVYAYDYDAYFNQYERGTYKLVSGSGKYISDVVKSFSVGAGYSSKGAFYADVAVRRTILPDAQYKAYANYLDNIVSPTVAYSDKLLDAVLTIGWRF